MNLSSSSEASGFDKSDYVMNRLLERIPENKIRPRLEPTSRAVSLLGDPQKSYRVIHITGTNGKTSTTRFIERILREYGLRTGRFTSPHLVRFNERISIDGEPVSDEQLYTVYSDIEPILEFVDQELIAEGESKLTFFEALAVLGFAVFAEAPVDVLVLEVGMGGAWDSTNVADGDVAVITPIGLDHMERLGNTIGEIALTKSGIIKSGALVISSEQTDEALNVIRKVSAEKAEAVKVAGEDFWVSFREPTSAGQRVKIQGLAAEYGPFDIPVFGKHQSQNLATAIAAVEAFLGGGKKALEKELLESALADLSSPGRLQLIPGSPKILLDGAHNPSGAKVLAASLRAEFKEGPLVGLVAILGEKDARGFLEELKGIFSYLVLTESSSPRASMARELLDISSELGFEAEAIPDFSSAYEAAKLKALSLNAMLVVTGSISLVGDVLTLEEGKNAK